MIEIQNGDCVKLMKDLKDNSVDFVLTDIPYDEVNRESGGLRELDKGLADILTFDLDLFLNEVYRVAKNSICIFCSREQFSKIYGFFARKDGTVRPIIWEKTNPSPMNGQYIYLSGVEFAVWFKKAGTKVFNARCKNTVFRYPSGSSEYHPTEKNHDLLKELILDNTNEGDTVLDTCMGSGRTAVVCYKTGRNFIGMELDRHYYEMIMKRMRAVISGSNEGLL